MQPAMPRPPSQLRQPVLERIANATSAFSQRYWRLVVVAMLLLLHIAAFRGVADPWARALLLAHLGLLLLWQPLLPAEQRVSAAQIAIVAIVAAVVMLRLDWWLLAFWVVVIAGLVGGKVYQHDAKWQRRCYLVMLAYLLALLAIVILPEIAPSQEINADTRRAAEYTLPLLFVLIALFPAKAEPRATPQVIDFFYSVFLMLLLVVVILGSFTFMTVARSGYLEALTYTVFVTAAAVLLVALAWNPRSGGGLEVFFARYLFSIGLPVERWLQLLAELLRTEEQPLRYLHEAVASLAQLPAVSGVAWRAGNTRGERGIRTPQIVEYSNAELELRMFSRYRLTPALEWHLQLLGRLLGEFYLAKLREEKLQQATYLQAVHETGARTTHDIKNLLQSLNVLVSVAADSDAHDATRLNALVRRQLPLVAERLSQTLERLQRPKPEGETYLPATIWWDAVSRQYLNEGVEFLPAKTAMDARVPRSLFESVADNLIRNALVKRASGRRVRVWVSLETGEELKLRVCDDGETIAEEIAVGLFRAPLASTDGLGIGLFQAARQAEASGFRLLLEKNSAGEVCFCLQGRIPAETSLP
jgi:signal transduction histidine kinase